MPAEIQEASGNSSRYQWELGMTGGGIIIAVQLGIVSSAVHAERRKETKEGLSGMKLLMETLR